MDSQQAISLINNIELKHKLFSFEHNGWSVWRLLRTRYFSEMVSLNVVVERRLRYYNFIRLPFYTVQLLFALLCAKKNQLFLKTYRTAFRGPSGEESRDVFFGYIREKHEKAFCLEQVNSRHYGTQFAGLKHKPHAATEPIDFLAYLLARFTQDNHLDAAVDEILYRVQNEDNIPVLESSGLKRNMRRMKIEARIYGLIFKWLKPKAVFVADAGDYPMLIAARNYGVPFIELQHGVFGEMHPDNIPSSAENDKTDLLIPDYFLSFGKFWLNQLENSAYKKRHTVAIGIQDVDHFRKSIKKRKKNNERPVFLFTSQGHQTDACVDWLYQQFSNEGRVCKLIVKLHPYYHTDRSKFEKLAACVDLEIVDQSDNRNIFELISICDFHLSISSACHFDSASLGNPSIVMPLPGHEHMTGFVDNQMIFEINEEESIFAITAKMQNLSGVDTSKLAEEYVASDYEQNVDRFLTGLQRTLDI